MNIRASTGLAFTALLVVGAARADDPFAQIPLLQDGSSADCARYGTVVDQLEQQRSAYEQKADQYQQDHQAEMQAAAQAQAAQMQAQVAAAMSSGNYAAIQQLSQQQAAMSAGMSGGMAAPAQCLSTLEGAFNGKLDQTRSAIAKRLAPDTDKFLAAAKACNTPAGSLNNVDHKCLAPAAGSYKTALAGAAPAYVAGINDGASQYKAQANACLDQAYAQQRSSYQNSPVLKSMVGGLASTQAADRYQNAANFAKRVQDSCQRVAGLSSGADQPFGDDAPVLVYRSYTASEVTRAYTALPRPGVPNSQDVHNAVNKALDSLFGH
jgi:hypothetical protein